MKNKESYYGKQKYIQNKINRLSGVLATLLAIVVAATILLCVGFGVYGSDVSKWFKPQNNVEQNNISDPTVINTVTEHGIALTSGEAMVASDGTLSKNSPQPSLRQTLMMSHLTGLFRLPMQIANGQMERT